MEKQPSFIHAIIYAPTDAKLGHVADLKLHPLVLAILRHDGKIGFPGGRIEEGENWEDGLKRELMEEIGFDLPVGSAVKVTEHLAGVRVTVEEFKQMERKALNAEHYGTEVLGIMRVPLYRNTRGRGLPHFLKHSFWGDPQKEIIGSLVQLGVLDSDFSMSGE